MIGFYKYKYTHQTLALIILCQILSPWYYGIKLNAQKTQIILLIKKTNKLKSWTAEISSQTRVMWHICFVSGVHITLMLLEKQSGVKKKNNNNFAE